MDNRDEWTCDANDAVQITIVQPNESKDDSNTNSINKPKTLSNFHPQFTYPIFGDEERIFGYKGLIIRLRFAAHDLRPHVHISYDERFKTVDDTAAVDLIGALKPFLPEEAFGNLPEYEKVVQEDETAKEFVPPGKLVHSYTVNQRNYEIWAGTLADPQVRCLLDRAQIFVSLFIEAGTPLATDDPEWTLQRWTVYFLYEKVTPPTPKASAYSIVGYATTYRCWLYNRDPLKAPLVSKDAKFPLPDVIAADLPARLRIAQFLILPPHQGSGHGVSLYTIIQSKCADDPTIVELTVEDPNEAFDALRDTADYHILLPEFTKHKIDINPDPYNVHSRNQRPRRIPTADLIPVKLLHDIRMSYKIAPTQFAHILEMFLLSRIPFKNRQVGGANMSRLLIKKYRADDLNERRYYWWRMLVKQRIYKRSRDLLIQLDFSDRIQKLDETVSNVEDGYELRLKGFGARQESFITREKEDKERDLSQSAAVLDEVSAKAAPRAGGGDGEGTLGKDQRVKRKFTVVEDDEDEGEQQDGDKAGKRPKV